MATKIDDVYDKLINDINANPVLERQLQINLQKSNHLVQMAYIQKHEDGFCSKFTIPDKEINNIFIDFPSVSNEQLQSAFISDWGIPDSAHMHSNIYYHKLLLITLYAAKRNKDDLGRYALSLVLFRIWNGRLCKLIRHCNPETMAAAVSRATNRLLKKYDSPLDLIQKYFAVTIYDKYKSYLLKDSRETKRMFEQCYNRVKQLFGSNNQVDLATGETRYQTGLQPEYYKAHTNKSSIGSTDPESEDKFSGSESEATIDHVSRFITTYKQVTYDTAFISMVTSNIKGLSTTTVTTILSKIHQLKYNDIMREIVEIFFRRLRGLSSQEICSNRLFEQIKIRINSSKNTQDVEFLKRITDKLLDDIFRNDLDKKYDSYLSKSENHRSQIRNVVFYGIGYNIQKATCEYR